MELTQTKKRNTTYYIKIAIGLVIMIGFRFIPPPAPITTAGMAVIGMFLSLIYMYSAVDVVWPNIVVMCVFAISAFDLFPASTMSAGIYEAGKQLFGGDMVVLLIGMMVLCTILSDCGLLKRMALWFITRKITKKGPWWFTIMFFLATFILGCCMNCAAMCVAMLSIAHECFSRLGFKRGDSYPRMMVLGIVWITSIGYAITPIGHDMAIMFNAMISAATNTNLSLFNYMLVGLPVGIIICVLMVLYFKLVIRPDMSPFGKADYEEIQAMHPGKITKQEMIVAVLSIVVLLSFILPGILDFILPGNGLSALLNALSPAFFIYAAIGLMAIIRVDGEPIIQVGEVFGKISWGLIILVGGIVMVALSMIEETTGITAWMEQFMVPLFNGMSPLVAIVIICICGVILTNILNNVAVGAMLCTVCAPLALTLGIKPGIMCMAICLTAQFGYTTPAAWPAIAFATGDEYNDKGGAFVLKHGIAITLISVVVSALMIYPLADLVYV